MHLRKGNGCKFIPEYCGLQGNRQNSKKDSKWDVPRRGFLFESKHTRIESSSLLYLCRRFPKNRSNPTSCLPSLLLCWGFNNIFNNVDLKWKDNKFDMSLILMWKRYWLEFDHSFAALWYPWQVNHVHNQRWNRFKGYACMLSQM